MQSDWRTAVTSLGINVLVTAIGGAGNGDQILKALLEARNTCRPEYLIFGADMNWESSNQELVHQFVKLPEGDSPVYLEELCRALVANDIRVVFPGSNKELVACAAHREVFDDLNVLVPIQSSELIEMCQDKMAISERLGALGVSTPRSLIVRDVGDYFDLDWYPVVVKPRLDRGGSKGVFVVQHANELEALLGYLNTIEQLSGLLIQEYVGIPEEEYTVGVLHDQMGVYVNSIAVRRFLSESLSVSADVVNSTERQDLGPRLVISSGISQGHIGRHRLVTEQCREIATRLGSKGPMNIQCRLIDGKVSVFEINPRLSGTVSMRAIVGFNEPDLLIRKHIANEDVGVDRPYGEAVVLRALTESVVKMEH